MSTSIDPAPPLTVSFAGPISGSTSNPVASTSSQLPLDPPATLRQTTALQQVQLQKQSRSTFSFEPFLAKEFNLGLYPDRAVCEYWAASTSNTPYGSHHKQDDGKCPLGLNCPLKHPSKIFKNKIVCKYWLRGLCKMGAHCDFLHEYNLSKMPECVHYSQSGQCQQAPECIYLHVDAKTKIAECPDYSELGFCPDGPNCSKRHVRRVICDAYLTGFCPRGPTCELAHPKFSVVRSQNGRFNIQSDEDLIDKRLKLLNEANGVNITNPTELQTEFELENGNGIQTHAAPLSALAQG